MNPRNSTRRGLLPLAAVVLLYCWTPAWLGAAEPLAPAAALAAFEFADPNLRIELVASEPEVSSPVAIAWDERRRLYVAEMRDYPAAKDGATIRRLEDRDGDGCYEHAIVFARELAFPNSVLPWNGGVFVTAAPHLWFLKDRDGDGIADERRVVFTGFGTGNQQLRANGLTWGLDGWIYGANGRSDGEIIDPARPDGSKHSLRGRDFRFHPATGRFETLAGRSQFGLARDDWGNRFLSWNTIPIRHEVFSDSRLANRPELAAPSVAVDLLPAGDAGELFPLAPAPRVFNTESSDHFNALAGLTIYRGDALGWHYRGSAFVGETLRNLVHRRVLHSAGATFLARRGEVGAEFLRSRDPWFHPVNFATGPDGALYVVDFYREFVEHPDFVPAEMRGALDWGRGGDHGRIWRIRQDSPLSPERRHWAWLAAERPRDWARALDSSNGWIRDTAQRRLMESGNFASALAGLRRLARTGLRAESRVQALCTLDALGAAAAGELLAALGDRHPRVRENALRLCAYAAAGRSFLAGLEPGHPLLQAVLRAARDSDDRVRLAAAFALATAPSGELRESALRELFERSTDPWVRLAAVSSSQKLDVKLAATLFPAKAFVPRSAAAAPAGPIEPDRQRLIERFRPSLELAGNGSRGAAVFAQRCLECHYFQGVGHRVGPDLSSAAGKPAEALLIEILDPSRVVTPDYTAYEVELANGETAAGLISSETATRLTLRRAGAPDLNLAKSEIRSVRATGKSLMPDGLDAGLDAQGIADLIQFLKAPKLEWLTNGNR